MPRGPKKHLKRLNAPSHWMLAKMDGIFAPRPSQGPHKLQECIPLVLILRNRLKYALTMQEVKMICMQRLIKIDGKVRTDTHYPCGFMDVVEIEKSGDKFRLLFNTKKRFVLHRLSDEEKKFKLCRVTKVEIGKKRIPYVVTHDGRTIRYPDPLIESNDTVKVDIESGKITDFIKFDAGNVVMVTKGRSTGRVGTIVSVEKHPGSFDIVTIKDAKGSVFATRLQNVFVIGKGKTPWVSLPPGNGIKLSILDEKNSRSEAQN
jgi:ribosomal protein S4E